MLGAVIGDYVGSVYEMKGKRIKTVDFPLFSDGCWFTDDTMMTAAVAKWLHDDYRHGKDSLVKSMVDIANEYRSVSDGYGGMFRKWLFEPENGIRAPYNSYGNGSAMRVSPVAMMLEDLDDILDVAKISAEITHNHPEGIKGAQAVAHAIYLANSGEDKDEIYATIKNLYYPDMPESCEQIRPSYKFDSSCQGSVPQAIAAFLDSHDFESAIRNAVSLGGDADTQACIAGSIAEAYYKYIPDYIIEKVVDKIPQGILDIINYEYEPQGLSFSKINS